MRGLVDILFTPNGSDEPLLHARMQGLFKDVLDDKKPSKAVKGKSRRQGADRSKSPERAPIAAISRVTRNRSKRKADEEVVNPQAPKRSRAGP